ncbi:hypothetical protein OHA18_38775 [Kribbella sp. NBC_00709]|uniref:hypothetical protein n=1 Tax=Kribbella sp. NBC_00709 TaxID=2975972 RepID=UPI002E2AF2D5|nr:hypothetical protein [Kribbella sp. NBC_00709]
MDTWQLTDSTAIGVHLGATDDLAAALTAIGLPGPRPVVVLVGGAGGLGADDLERLRPLIAEALVPVLEEYGAVAIDGGTDAGVMRLLGQERAGRQAGFPLVGVVAQGTVNWPGEPPRDGTADFEPNHTRFLAVPGTEWGDEAPWIADAATVLAGSAPSITLLVNGGQIAYDDAARSIESGRPVLVVEGSGRTADQFAAALRGEPADARAVRLARSGLVSAVPLDSLPLRLAITSALDRSGDGP